MRGRSGVRVLEPPRIRHQPDIESRRHLGIHRETAGLEHVVQDGGGRRSRRIDQIQFAIAGIVLMVVDVDPQDVFARSHASSSGAREAQSSR